MDEFDLEHQQHLSEQEYIYNKKNYYGCIYRARNILNNKVYVGYTINILEKRKHEHILSLKNSKHFNYRFQMAWAEYGNVFEWNVIDVAYSFKDMEEKEKQWIKFYDANDEDFGYNIAGGGNGIEYKFNPKFNKKITLKKIKFYLNQNLRFTEIAKKLGVERRTIIRRLKRCAPDIYLQYKNIQDKLYKESTSGKDHPNYINISIDILEKIKQELINNNYNIKPILKKYEYDRQLLYRRLNDQFPGFGIKVRNSVNIGKNNNFYGKKHKKESLNQISETKKKKIPENILIQIKKDIEEDIKIKGKTNFAALERKYNYPQKIIKRRYNDYLDTISNK